MTACLGSFLGFRRRNKYVGTTVSFFTYDINTPNRWLRSKSEIENRLPEATQVAPQVDV